MSTWKIVLLVIAGLAIIGVSVGYYMFQYAEVDMYVPMFADNCGECHGDDLRGTDKGVALIDNYLEGGDTVAGLIQSIRFGNPDAGMPAYDGVLTNEQIKGLAIFIGERRLGQSFTNFRFDIDLEIPEGPVESEEHSYIIETFAEGLSHMPFGIEPLPDGSFLLTEKQRGLFIVSPDGVLSDPIEGTPKTSNFNIDIRGIQYGVGWLLGVEAHPDYEENGWVYLHYTDVCDDDCENEGFYPSSMNRLERGRIKEGKWVDAETIWRADEKWYTPAPDTGAGGRIAFDEDGHVFIAVGIKGMLGPQDLDNPFGKIHRINDDGTIPPDNPFVVSEAARSGDGEIPFTRQTTWTYGHRSPQGLEWNYLRGTVWNAEMGPRGGDEINELLPGRNYGWPYHSLGLEYSGETVAKHKLQDVEFDPEDSEMTLVDFTPSPAISSFAFYSGDKFPKWKDNVLLGSLKGNDLFRLVFDGNKLVHMETVLKDLARIRDVEIGYDGLVYLLLEMKSGSRIVRLAPADQKTRQTASIQQ